MASLAQDTFAETRSAKPPISAHPAFPAIVALWFSALLGLGSLILPLTMVEQFVTATGLAEMIPALAPPLGFTVRGAIAISGAILGAIIGFAIARAMRKSSSKAPEGRKRMPVRQPINAHADLGENGFDGDQAENSRRRSLIAEEDLADDQHGDLSTIPGQALVLEETAEEPAQEEEIIVEEVELETDMPPADLHKAEDQAEEDKIEFEIDDAWVEDEDALDAEIELEYVPAQSFEIAEETDQSAVADEVEAEQRDEDMADWQTAQLEDLGMVQLALRLNHAIAKRREQRKAMAELSAPTAITAQAVADDAGIAEADVAAEAIADYFGAPSEPSVEEVAPETDTAFDAQEDIALEEAITEVEAAALETDAEPSLEVPELSFDDLVPDQDEIFEVDQAPAIDEIEADMEEVTQDVPFASFSEEAQTGEDPTSPEPSISIDEDDRQVFEPVEAVESEPPFQLSDFGKFDLDEEGEDDEDEDLAASFSLPLTHAEKTVDLTSAEDEEIDESENANFGSLLSEDNPFRNTSEQFVRIEDEPEAKVEGDEPAVIFPGESGKKKADKPAPVAVDSEENERALREALLNLQRMSGAA